MGLPTQEAQLADIFSNVFTSDIPRSSMSHCKGVSHGAQGLGRPKVRLQNPDHLASPVW